MTDKIAVKETVRNFYELFPFPNDNPDSFISLEIHKWILFSLPKPIKIGSKIIDVGCGTGEMSCFLSKFGHVTGLDFCDNSLAHAEDLKAKLLAKNLPSAFLDKIQFIKEDLVNLNHKEKYDYVFCIGVLHHIPQFKEAINNLKTLVKNDGYIIISLYNKHSHMRKKYIKLENQSREKDTYEHPFRLHFSEKEAARILERHGLEIVGMYRHIPAVIRYLTRKGKMMTFCCKLKKGKKLDVKQN